MGENCCNYAYLSPSIYSFVAVAEMIFMELEMRAAMHGSGA